MPSDAWTAGLVAKEFLVVMVLAAFLGAEFLRLGLRLEVFGFRDYEARQVSAFTWAALGLTLALLLFPMVYVVPALLLVAWVDPLCRAARHRDLYPWLPLAVAVTLVAVVLGLESYTSLLALEPVGLAAIGILAGATAVAAEAPRLRLIDDDFRMLLAPLVVMSLVGGLLQHL